MDDLRDALLLPPGVAARHRGPHARAIALLELLRVSTSDALEEILAAKPENMLRPRIVLQQGDDERPFDRRWFAVLQDVQDEDDIEKQTAVAAADTPVGALFALAAWLRAMRVPS